MVVDAVKGTVDAAKSELKRGVPTTENVVGNPTAPLFGGLNEFSESRYHIPHTARKQKLPMSPPATPIPTV
jgi:hypothetical protein